MKILLETIKENNPDWKPRSAKQLVGLDILDSYAREKLKNKKCNNLLFDLRRREGATYLLMLAAALFPASRTVIVSSTRDKSLHAQWQLEQILKLLKMPMYDLQRDKLTAFGKAWIFKTKLSDFSGVQADLVLIDDIDAVGDFWDQSLFTKCGATFIATRSVK